MDVFNCLGPIPITRLRWWGSYKAWNKPELPATLPQTWQISFWINRPEKVDATLFPEKLAWRLDVPAERVRALPVGSDQFPRQPAETCFMYELTLEPDEWFRQTDFPSERDVYWLAIAPVYAQGAAERNHWGWLTRPAPWGGPAQIAVLYGDGPAPETSLFPGMLSPVASDLVCSAGQGYDVTFELLTDPPWIKWDQPFTGIRSWPYYDDIESQGTSIRGQENIGRLVADDWVCERNTPLIAAAWWGSYIGHDYEACQCDPQLEPPRPDYFLLRMWNNVPASHGVPDQPGEVVWDYRAFDYDEVLAGHDKNPEREPNEPVYRYSARLPEENWFRQEAPGTVYWFSVTAVYTDPLPMIVHPWGWTNHPPASESGAVFIDYGARPGPEWRPLRDPLDRPVDMSFTLFTLPEEPPTQGGR